MHFRPMHLICFSFNLFAGLLLSIAPSLYQYSGTIIFITAFFILVFIIHFMRDDFMSQLRLAFLSAVGFYAGFVKILSPDMGFSGFGLHAQTFEIGVLMFGMTLIATSSVQISYEYARSKHVNKSLPLLKKIPKQYLPIIYFTTLILILIVGFFSAESYGPPVWLAPYASGQGEGQLLGNLQPMGVIFIGINYLCAVRLNSRIYWIFSVFAFLFLLVWGILIRGGRLEFLSGILTLFVIQKIIRGQSREMPVIAYVYLFIMAVVMEYIGHLRYTLTEVDAETMVEGIIRMLDDGFLFIGTISGIASSFANVLHMIQNDVIEFQLGFPYFEYFLRTPPEFIYPDRPKDLSAIFEQYGYDSIGGFFELSEAYLSFGLLGVFIIPGVITYVFKRIHDKAMGGSLFNYIMLLAILSVFMRGGWYQTFAYYKALVTGLIIYFGLRLLLVIFRPPAKLN